MTKLAWVGVGIGVVYVVYGLLVWWAYRRAVEAPWWLSELEDIERLPETKEGRRGK